MGLLDDLKKIGKSAESEAKKAVSTVENEAAKVEKTVADETSGLTEEIRLMEKIWPKIRTLISQLKNPHQVTAHQISQLTDEDLASLPLDAVQYFNLLTAMGQAMAEKIAADPSQRGVPFSADFVEVDPVTKTKTEILVTRKGDVPQIQKQMSNPAWVDKQAT